jgi:hypothetical protein
MIDIKFVHLDHTQTTAVHVQSGKSIVLPEPLKKLEAALKDYRSGELIQDVFPFLSPDHREFMISGTLPGDWEILYPEEND